MRLAPPPIGQLLVVCCPSVVPTFHVIRVRRWVHVELCEDGLWIYVSGEQRGLYRVMESLFKTSRIELPSIRIPHYLLRKWQKRRMHCHILVNLNSHTGVSQKKKKSATDYKSIHVLKWTLVNLSLERSKYRKMHGCFEMTAAISFKEGASFILFQQN